MKLPTIALAIRQPWASLIIHGGKDIENRDWPTEYRGPVLIHASKVLHNTEAFAADNLIGGRGIVIPEAFDRQGRLPLGGIIGVADIVDCVTKSDSPWFVGEYGFVLANPRPLPFHPVRGFLGFFKVEYPWADVPGSPNPQSAIPNPQ